MRGFRCSAIVAYNVAQMPALRVLGIDVGSVSVSAVQTQDGKPLRWVHRAHAGQLEKTVRSVLSEFSLRDTAIVATSSTPRIVHAESRVDWLTALVGAHRLLHPESSHLLVVGGERFVMLHFDGEHNYQSSRGNTSCAAGTGAFLDQQAARLGLTDAAALGRLAVSNTGSTPTIASRCSVFAKTDLIHAQQEGYTVPEISDGLCVGLARNLVDAVVAGTGFTGSLVMAGGVALNRAVVHHVGRLLSTSVRVHELAPVYAAIGAATVAVDESLSPRTWTVDQLVDSFQSIAVKRVARPKAGVFGDLYVRDNEVMNQDLLRSIDAAGGEAVTTPYGDYVKIVARAAFGRLWRRRDLGNFAKLRLILAAISRLERPFLEVIEPVLGSGVDWRRPGLQEELGRFHLVLEQAGESYENALKVMHLINHHPDLALFVQTSPAFCCPSLVTEALSELMEKITGVPMITITYDGTEGDRNGAIATYIRFARPSRVTGEKTA